MTPSTIKGSNRVLAAAFYGALLGAGCSATDATTVTADAGCPTPSGGESYALELQGTVSATGGPTGSVPPVQLSEHWTETYLGQVPERACQEVLAGRSMRGFSSKARQYSGMPEGAGGFGSLVASDLAQIRRRFGQA